MIVTAAGRPTLYHCPPPPPARTCFHCQGLQSPTDRPAIACKPGHTSCSLLEWAGGSPIHTWDGLSTGPVRQTPLPVGRHLGSADRQLSRRVQAARLDESYLLSGQLAPPPPRICLRRLRARLVPSGRERVRRQPATVFPVGGPATPALLAPLPTNQPQNVAPPHPSSFSSTV